MKEMSGSGRRISIRVTTAVHDVYMYAKGKGTTSVF